MYKRAENFVEYKRAEYKLFGSNRPYLQCASPSFKNANLYNYGLKYAKFGREFNVLREHVMLKSVHKSHFFEIERHQ